jgi:polysaccharide export outer membrane protein
MRGYMDCVNSEHVIRVLLLAICATLLGCAANEVQTDLPTAGRVSSTTQQCTPDRMTAISESSSADMSTYRIQPGDTLDIHFYLSPEFDDEVTVRPDGKITLKLIGDVGTRDQTPARLATALNRAYSRELLSPDVTVHVKTSPSRQIYVDGQVTKPGAFPLIEGMTAEQAIAQAGGLTDNAGSDSAIIIRRDACGAPYGIRFNLNRAVKQADSNEDWSLMPADIVFVPRSTIANVNLWVKQYITNMIPIPPYAAIPL